MTVYSFGKTSTGKWTPEGAFQHIVAPVLMARGLLPRGELVHAEGTSQDERLGIDWIISLSNGGQATVGARVQWDHDYGSFTIRYRTERGNRSELTKRYWSVARNGTYPTYTVQAYVTQPDGRLLNAYVVGTAELYRHLIHPTDDGTDEHFQLCGCAGRKMWAYGAEFIPVAISEEAKNRIGTRSTLIADGVDVRSVAPFSRGDGLWT